MDQAERKVRRFRERPMRPGDPGVRPRGRLLIIGGAEDRDGDRKAVLGALAECVGSGKLVIATVAGELPEESWQEYETALRGLGVRHLYRLPISDRSEAESPRSMRILEDASAVFFTGGDQLRITSLLGDTPVFSRIEEIFREGGTIAGTSAGAAIMSETMIVRGNSKSSQRIRTGDLQLAPGLGFAKDMMIDQHFAERGRIARLLLAIGQNPRMLGVGIDENTAIEVWPFKSFRVVGEGNVYVLDGSKVTATNLTDQDSDSALSLFGVTLHVLGTGDEFQLETRKPRLHESKGEGGDD